MEKYNKINTEKEYNKLLQSGMFFEFHPELTGKWITDKELIIRINSEILKSIKFKEIYDEIKIINSIEQVSSKKRLCKLFEEVGELTQEINKKIGRKVSNETDEEIIGFICEEAADTIQCIFSFMDSIDMDITFIEGGFDDNSNKENIQIEEILMKLFKHIGCLSYELEHKGSSNKKTINKCISKVLTLTNHFGINESDLISKIMEKNIKWKSIIKNN